MNNKARFLPFVIALALLAAIFVLPHASSAAAGTVKLSSNFTTTPDGNLAVTVADADLNTGVVSSTESFSLKSQDYAAYIQVPFTVDRVPFLDAGLSELIKDATGDANGHAGPEDVVLTFAGYDAADTLTKDLWDDMTTSISGQDGKAHPAGLLGAGQFYLGSDEAAKKGAVGISSISFTATYKGPAEQYATANISSTQDSTGINLRLKETGDQTGEFKFDGGFDTNTYTTNMVKLDATTASEEALGVEWGGETKTTEVLPIVRIKTAAQGTLSNPVVALAATTIMTIEDYDGRAIKLDNWDIKTAADVSAKGKQYYDVKLADVITRKDDDGDVTSASITFATTAKVVGEALSVGDSPLSLTVIFKLGTDNPLPPATVKIAIGVKDVKVTNSIASVTPITADTALVRSVSSASTTTTEVALGADLNGDGDKVDTTPYGWLDVTKVSGAHIPKGATLGYLVNKGATTCAGGVTKTDAGGTDDERTICQVTSSVPTIKAIDGSQITASYSDGGTNRIDNATVEVQNPTINIIGPAHGDSTRVRGARLIAELTDADSGIDESTITFVVQPRDVLGANETAQTYQDGYNLDGTTSKDKDVVTTVSIAGGVRAEVQLADIGGGETKIFWTVHVKDTAGNRAVADRDATDDDELDLNDDPTKRAASVDCDATLDVDKNNDEENDEPDCFRLRIDTEAPKLGSISIDHDGIEDNALKPITGAITGNYLDDEGKAVENAKKASKTSIRVIFNEALNGDSLQANDFRVNSIAPVGVSFSSKHPKSAFLTVPDMVSNLKPTVEVTGDVEDAAGNVRPGGESTTGVDGISPSIGITVSPSYAQEQVTIDIITDEPLLTVPTITLNGEKRTDLNGLGAVTLVATNHYRATVKPTGAGALESYNIEVTGSDTSSNPQSAGKAATHDDAILFEIDNALPKPARVALPGKDVVAEPVTDSGDAKYGGDAVGITTMNPFITIDWSNEGTEYTNPEAIAAIPAVAAVAAVVADPAKGIVAKAAVAAVAGVPAVKAVDADTHGAVDVTNLTIGGVAITTPVGDETGSVTNDGDATYVVSRKSENELLISARGLALGVYEISFNGADELGNTLKDDIKVKFEVKAPAPFKVTLTPGWNLISLPANPIDGDINTLIGADHPIQTVSTYDPTQAGGWLTSTRGADGAFEGTIETISARTAYWVFTNGFDALEVDITRQSGGQVQALPTINLVAGWNLLPVLDVTGSKAAGDEVDDVSGATRVYSYDSGTSSFIAVVAVDGDPRMLKVGSGYWVYMKEAAVLVP